MSEAARPAIAGILENDVVPGIERVLDSYPFEDRRGYAAWLAQTYYYVRHSTRLLCAAAGRFPAGADDAAHYRFAAHVAEEKRHEMLAFRDLSALGFDLRDLPELPATRSFYEIQYAKADRGDPIALMGHVLVLELTARSRGAAIASRVAAAHGPAAGSFLAVHAADDPEHVERAYRLLARLPEDRLFAAAESAFQAMQLYLAILAGAAALGLAGPGRPRPGLERRG